MRHSNRFIQTLLMLVGTAALLAPAFAQALPPVELDRLVSRIALYPDPLLAQVLAASTFSDQIPAAAAYLPTESRSANSGGSPACRILSWAFSTS